MEVPLWSLANVRKMLELLDLTDATKFTALPEQCHDRQALAIYYHA